MVTGNRNPEELREIAEDTILPRIEQVPGVATGSVSGGREKIIRVEIPQSRLEAYGLTVTSLQSMLASQNIQVSAGSITDDSLTYILTTMGEYTSLDQIKNTVISYRGGAEDGLSRTIRLRDMADIFEGYKDEQSKVYVNGIPAVQIRVQKQSGKNSVQTAHALRARLAQIGKEIPQDIKITEIFNTTDEIESSINQVVSTALQGGLLAIIVLFVFLRSFKPTIIIGISIPVSIIITIMLMYFSGLTLNMMTIAGLTLGVGMLVDNSIVVLENICRYREKGAKLIPSSVLGTQEMTLAIVSSTLTTICIFAPLVAFQGMLEMMGEMFAGLAFTVVISLAISLVVALLLVPVLSSHYFPVVTRKQKPLTGPLAPVDKLFERFFAGLEKGYRRGVGWVLRHKVITLATVFVVLCVSLYLTRFVGFVFMPPQEEDSVTISVTMPIGTSLAETEATLRRLEAVAEREVQGYERMVVNVGGGGGMMSFGGSSTYTGSLRINLPDLKDRIDLADDVKTKMRKHFNDFPGVFFNFSSGGFGGGSSNPVEILIKTQDLVKGKAIAERIAELIRENVPSITEPEVDLKDGLPQLELHIDRERLYALGLNTATVGNEVKAAVDGLTATRYKSGNKDYDVVLILAEADRSKVPDLDKIFINSPVTGQRVPLSNFASFDKGTGPITISRENQSRVVKVTGGVAPGTKINEVDQEVRALITAAIPAEDGVIIEFGGDFAETMKYIQRFVLIMALAVMLVFGVMASIFESFKDPFIVLFTMPLALIGVVAIYLITNDTFNVLTAVGLLVLVGVIVNNGIVLVDYTNMLRKRGYSLNEACIEAAGNRLRPILMSTLTTVLGLLPMAFFPGEGSELVAPIGKTTFGGLSFGTLMTLFVMPTIYAVMNKRSEERAAKAKARRERIAAGLSRKQAKAQGGISAKIPDPPKGVSLEKPLFGEGGL
jgi:HAE1 family hydrophobic/amphiphilic exporter-1